MDHLELLNTALSKNETIIISCTCIVEYSGRAESFLPAGERIILIKADKTLLVHQPTGNNPVNYMKAGTDITVREEKGNIVVHGRAAKEYIDIMIDKVYALTAQKLEDCASLVLNGTEKDMSDMLYDNPNMIEKGFRPLRREEHTKYGFIDVFGYDRNNVFTVVECKRQCGDPKAVDQLRRYVEKVKETKGVDKVRGILACPKLSPKAQRMIEDYGFDYVKVEPPKYLERFGRQQKSLDQFT